MSSVLQNAFMGRFDALAEVLGELKSGKTTPTPAVEEVKSEATPAPVVVEGAVGEVEDSPPHLPAQHTEGMDTSS